MFCGISGEPPQDPVVSKKSGLVYEKRLITKYIADHGKDPVTGEDIQEDDLLEIKASPKTVKPRPATLTSIPSLLSVFQNEWDSLMLETFTLKQQYQQVRQELSHALYQHDAACRVIARLMKERDAAREALANVQAHIDIKPHPEAATESQAMETDEQERGINEVVINKLNETSAVLSKSRKKRKPPPELTSIDTIKSFAQIFSIGSLHTSTAPGITCMDIDQTEQLILTGGNDKKVLIINKQEGKMTSKLQGHTKKITDVLWHGSPNEEGYDTVFTASADKSIRIWQRSDKAYKISSMITAHNAEVTGISVHATKDYLMSVSNDSTWAFHDIHTAQTLAQIETNEVTNGYSTVEIHPDGLILGTGTNDSIVRIWDIKTQKNVTSFDDHSGRITSIAFSENGYYLATSEDSAVKLWDLRKLLILHTIQLDEGSKVNKICWDYSGQYLGVCGTDVRIYQAKPLNQLAVFTDNTSEATDIKFGEFARNLYVSGLDRTLRFYGVEEEEE